MVCLSCRDNANELLSSSEEGTFLGFLGLRIGVGEQGAVRPKHNVAETLLCPTFSDLSVNYQAPRKSIDGKGSLSVARSLTGYGPWCASVLLGWRSCPRWGRRPSCFAPHVAVCDLFTQFLRISTRKMTRNKFKNTQHHEIRQVCACFRRRSGATRQNGSSVQERASLALPEGVATLARRSQ